MHAVIQSLQWAVVTLATIAFAHFGVAVRDAPAPKPAAAVQRTTISTKPLPKHAPCPLEKSTTAV
jgi:hypothetical protein